MKATVFIVALAGGVVAGFLLPVPLQEARPDRNESVREETPFSPAKEWQAAMSVPSAAARFERLSAVLARTGAAGLPGLLQAGLTRPPLRDMVLRRWLECDRPGLLAWLEQQHGAAGTNRRYFEDAFATVTELIAQQDPADALAAARAWAFLSGETRRRCAGLALHAAFDSNPSEGLKLFSSNGDPDVRVGTGWIARHSAEAQKIIPQMPVGLARGEAVNQMISLLRPSDPAAAVQFVAQFPLMHRPVEASNGGPQTYPQAGLYADWVRKDRQAVIDYANDHATGHLRAGLLAAVSKVIGAENPSLALNWTRENLSGDARKNAVCGIFSDLAGRDPAAAIALIDSASGASRGSALEGVVRARASAAPAETLGSYLAMPASATRDELIRDTVGHVFMGGLREAEFKTWLAALPPAQAEEVRRLSKPSLKGA
jgi:hypothetical protein